MFTSLWLQEKDFARRILLTEKRAIHYKHVHQQRESYYDRRFETIHNPDKFMSIILDGMDQAKLGLPHFCVSSKDEDFNKKIKMKLIGMIIHGRENCNRTFFVPPQFGADTNAYVEVYISIMIQVHIYLSMYMDYFP